jgi:sodium-independent sulfate anion transporter 11
MGESASRVPRDLGAVVPYRDGRTSSDLDSPHLPTVAEDIETGDVKKVRSRSSSQVTNEFEPIVPLDTPFFHIDLQGAVRAAESGVGRFSATGQSAGSN